MSSILELETKMRRGVPLQESELALAQIHLRSQALKERVIAYELILYDAKPAECERIIPLIERECAQVLNLQMKYPATFLLVLRRMPWSSVASSPICRQFIISAATEGGTGARVNSILLLKKLAKSGDVAALETLRTTLSDNDGHVRANAQRSWSRIEGRNSANKNSQADEP